MRPQEKARLDEEALLNYALRSLGMHEMSISELRGKLEKRAADEQAVPRVLSRLKQAGYLNDRRFADAFAASRLANQGFGKARVLSDLAQRRVPGTLAHQAVDEVFQETDESKLVEAFLTRRFRHTDLKAYLAEEKHLAGAYRRLRRAGFTAAVSIRVLKRYAERAGELESMEDGPAEPPES